MSKEKLHFDGIDILRGFAAISVVVYHVIEHFNWSSFPTTGLLLWFRFGWMGVDMFFVISGFVIALSAFKQIGNVNDAREYKNFFRGFMTRRLNRIVPLHYLTILIFTVFISPSIILLPDFSLNIFSHLLFFHNVSYNLHGAINGSNWSLGVEMQFYIFIAIFAKRLRQINPMALLAIALTISYCWRFMSLLLVNQGEPLGVFKLFVIATQLPGMLDEFVIGILLARLIVSENIFHYLNTFGSKLLLPIITVLLIVISMCIYLHYSSFWNYPLMVIFFRTLLALSFGCLILLLCLVRVPPILKSLIYPLYYCGTISYGVYLWHLPILLSIKSLNLSNFHSLVLVLSLTLLLASLSWHFFEKKFID